MSRVWMLIDLLFLCWSANSVVSEWGTHLNWINVFAAGAWALMLLFEARKELK